MSDTIPSSFDWADRYARNDTNWDLGMPHPELAARIAAGELHARRAFVGGCGRGHDALALARAEARVTAIDIVPALAEGLADRLRALGGEFLVADALAFVPKEPFDLVFEHTFFCALPPTLRPRWGELARRVLAPKGRLWALVFPFDKPLEQGGPPFGTTTDDLATALGPGFRLLEDAPVRHRSPKRAWREHWAVFEAQ
ncbi:MAG: methyltransferase domain-containing protein [Casimicrobiaceae bacterium]